jgi:uncharacterized membrane protein HdeD (DUF308 family)
MSKRDKMIVTFLICNMFSCFQKVGALAGLAGVAYMARAFKNRDKNMKISVYVIHTRMLAQMTVVGEPL